MNAIRPSPPRPSASRHDVVAVVLWMLGALVSFSATAVAVRTLSPSFGVFEILGARNAGGLVLLAAAALVRPGLAGGLRVRHGRLHLVRNMVHFGATYAWALGVTLLPLATVFALEFTTPAWVALLALAFLGERLTAGRLTSIALGFLGVLVILRPGVESLRPAAFVVLAAAFGFAVTTVLTKRLTETESTYAILVWMNLVQLPLNLLGGAPGFWARIEPAHLVPFLGVCLGGLFSHLCLTNAYRHGDTTMVVPLDFLRVPLIAIVGWSLFGEALDPYVFLGSALIIGGVLSNLRAEARTGGRGLAGPPR